MDDKRLDVAIIGGGVSGTSLAVALSSRANPRFTAAIFEPAELGPGAAYAPQSASLLVNGPVRAMSAIASDKEHLARYLVDEPGDSLICRARYGAYIRATASAALAAHNGITHIKKQIVDLEQTSSGFKLLAQDATSYLARNVVLALGNFAPSEDFLPRELREYSGFARDPWRVDVAPFENRDVALIGNRLTAMDVIALLDERAFRGSIHVISRHGLTPNVEDTKQRGIDLVERGVDTATPLRLLRSLRRIAKSYDGDWRCVCEGLRPISGQVWSSWPLAERARFLRHLASMWGVHRYRVPPATFAAYVRLAAEGRIQSHAGRITGAKVDSMISLELEHAGARRVVRAAHVVNCTGPSADITKVESKVVQNALSRGLIRPDELHLGVDATTSFSVLSSTGEPVQGLFAMGPLLRGLWYETTAVPEVTAHAAAIAAELLSDVTSEQVGVAS